MFLSRIELNTQLDIVRRALASPSIFHAAVEGCFPRREGGNERKLWRLDALANRLYLLALSPERPDFTHFAAQFCAPNIVGETKNYDAFLSKIDAGQTWKFRLRANATHSVKVDGKRGKVLPHISVTHQQECRQRIVVPARKRLPHISVTHQQEWLIKKSTQCGFSVGEKGKETFDVVEDTTMQFRHIDRKNVDKQTVTLGVAVYEGTLVVTDGSLFRAALTAGVGRAKAFGCGLLTIAKPL